MKNFKRIMALLLAVAMCAVLFAACGDQSGQTDESSSAAADGYQVKVVDALGNPYTSGVIVRFMQGGQQVSMQVADENGVATKDLPDGDYTVELQFTNTEAAYHYDASGVKLTADNKTAEVILSYGLTEETQNVCGHDAHNVNLGCTYVELTAGERNYFLFTPTQAGKYEFSVIGSDAPIGYYGAPHFVQENSAAEVVDNSFTQNIKAGMIGTNGTGTSVLVIGIDAGESDTNAILAIERLGDPDWTVEDEPWQVYQATTTLTKYTLPAGAKLGEFDLTASTDTYNLVLDSDGFYHLDSADGPLVLMRLGEVSEGSKYLDSFETIINHSGLSKYFFDENGEFVKKESYTECVMEYIEYMDEDTGLYPLTEDLKYIIQQRGEYVGWFDPDQSLYLFVDANGDDLPGINNEISWLFMCCYIEQ